MCAYSPQLGLKYFSQKFTNIKGIKCVEGFSRNGMFLRKICTIYANFCASFAHEAGNFLRNIPHGTFSHATRFEQFAQKSKLRKFFAQFSQKPKLRKQQNCSNATFCAKTICLLEN